LHFLGRPVVGLPLGRAIGLIRSRYRSIGVAVADIATAQRYDGLRRLIAAPANARPATTVADRIAANSQDPVARRSGTSNAPVVGAQV
jgi:hypothetical protein